MARAMQNGKEPVFTYPTSLDATDQQDRLKVFTYEREYTRVDDEKRAFMENNHRTYKLLTLHCSPATGDCDGDEEHERLHKVQG